MRFEYGQKEHCGKDVAIKSDVSLHFQGTKRGVPGRSKRELTAYPSVRSHRSRLDAIHWTSVDAGCREAGPRRHC